MIQLHDGYFPNDFLLISYLGYILVRSCEQSFFCRKKQLNDENHAQGTHSAKMGADSLAENTPKNIWPTCQIGQNVWDIVEKSLHGAAVVRG